MKRLMYLFLSIFIVAGTTTAEAQFLKNLKKQVEKKVEKTITKNVSDKAASETDKSLNKLWEKQLDSSYFSTGMNMANPEEIPESYNFDWEYTLNLETPQGNQEMVYLIKEDAPFVGMKIPAAENMLTVLDSENNMTVIYLNSEDNKMVMATKNPDVEDVTSENPYEDMKLEKIGKKTILGYECQGYRSENSDQVYEFYVTDEAGVSFKDLYHENQKNIPEGWDTDWLNEGDGLMMSMMMKDKNNAENTMTMTCTGIEKKPFSIATSDYQTMNMGGN